MEKQKLKERKSKTQKGITLVALIITIIVLLILAIVTIRAVQGDGIIKHAKNARDEYEQAKVNEQAKLEGYLGKIEDNLPNTSSSAFASITAENYGDKVAYSAGEVSDWKVFYKDDSYLYIITSDYINNANLPKGLKMSIDGTYVTYWEDENAFTSTGASDITMAVANKYGLGWLNENASSTNSNARATADLLNTTAWTAQFGDTSKGIEAVGGPTLEMWVKSWNAKGYINLKIAYDSTGYYVGTTENQTDYYVDISSDTAGCADKLYLPNTSDFYGYLLASPNSKNDVDVMYVHCYGASGISEVYWGDMVCGVRPVVSIPSNLVEEKNASGAWTIKE